MFIGIVGCIGVGKSRLTEALADHLGYRAYFEPVKENPYLDDYYADPRRYACIMQFFMLTQRFKQHVEIQDLLQRNIGVVQDQIIFGDVLYGKLTHQHGFMDDRDFETYASHFETIRPLLKLPDVIIHLDTTVETLQQRIKERGRASEQRIDRKYLEDLNALFHDWTNSVRTKTNVIRLNWNAYLPVMDVVRKIEEDLDIQLQLPVVASQTASAAA